MPLDLTSIDQNVNDNLAAQAPTSGKNNGGDGGSAPITPVEPSVENAEQSDLDKATARIAELQAERIAERAAHEADLAAARQKVILDAAMKPPTTSVGRGKQDAAIAKVINTIDNARFHALSPQKRCETIGIYGSEQVTDATVRKYFGPDTSAAATQLQKSNPAEYSRLRGIARCRGIL